MNMFSKRIVKSAEGLLLEARSNSARWIIVLSLGIVYLLVFPSLQREFGPAINTLVALPVALATWYFGLQGGLVAATLGVSFNISLLVLGQNYDLAALMFFGLVPRLLALAAMIIGVHFLRRRVENQFHVMAEIRSREEYLALLNRMTNSVLLLRQGDSTLRSLTADLATLFHADDCYVICWDEENQLALPLATTANFDELHKAGGGESGISGLLTSVLKAERSLIVDDILDSPEIHKDLAGPVPSRSFLGMPLRVGDHTLGAILLAYQAPHRFSSDEIERSEQAASQLALALWGFQQSTEIQQRLKESDALARIGRALSETERIGTGEVLQLIVDSACNLISRAEASVIHLLQVDEQALIVHAVSGLNGNEKEPERIRRRLGEGVAGQVIRDGITISIGDITTDPRFLSFGSPPSFRSLLVAPIQSGAQRIGTISVQSKLTNAFSGKDSELLNALGVQAAIAFENSRLFENTQKRLKEVGALYQVSRGLATSLEVDELIREIVALLQRNFHYHHVQVFLVEPATGDLILRKGSGEIGQRLLNQGFHLSKGRGIIGRVAETGTPFLTNNVNEVEFHDPIPFLADAQSELSVPVMLENKAVGVLDIQNVPPNRFGTEDLQLMVAVADQLAAALQKANLYRNLQEALQQEQTIRSQLFQAERLAVAGQLLASVSHELNNPLQAIENALFLLREEKSLSPQVAQDLEIILSETERMTSILTRLRTTYRPSRDEDFKEVGLNSLIETTFALTATLLRHKGVQFGFTPDLNLPPVSCIPDQIRQVILNLFLNAVEAMPEGGILTVRTGNEAGRVLISVSDTGTGIAPDIQPHLFEPFFTSKQTGSGLGLSITRDIVLHHQGEIRAENNPEGGATFKLWLPLKRHE